MENWKLINTYDRADEAKLHKKILKNNGIKAVVIPKKDSTFLWGEFQLFVHNRNEEIAREYIDEYLGWFKVASFSRKSPIVAVKNILETNQISTLLLSKKEVEYLYDNFELYVANEQAIPATTLLKSPNGWSKIFASDRIGQIESRIDILENDMIDVIVLKRRDSGNHLIAIEMYVPDNLVNVAVDKINQMEGWVQVNNFKNLHRAELAEELLKKQNIDSIILDLTERKQQTQHQIGIFVRNFQESAARQILDENREWHKLQTCDNAYQAEIIKEMLVGNGIEAVVIVKKDSAFLWGDIDLYVEQEDLGIARMLIKEYQSYHEIEESETDN